MIGPHERMALYILGAVLILVGIGFIILTATIAQAAETEERYLLVYEELMTWPGAYGMASYPVSRMLEVMHFETQEKAIDYLNNRKIKHILGLWKVEGRVHVEMEMLERVEPETVQEKRWIEPQWRVKGE